MTALYIVLPIVLFVALLLFSRVRFSLMYDDGIRLGISYLFVRIPLYPRKKKLSKRKTAQKSKPRKKTKPKIAEMHEAQNTAAPSKKGKEKPPLKLGDIRFLLRLFRDVLSHVLAKSSRHVRIVLRRVRLSIGGERDAARAAIEYGIATQSISYLLEFLQNTGFLKRPRAKAIDVGVNFLNKDHELTLRTDTTCRLFFLIPLALSSLTKALTAKARWSRHRARRAAELHANNQHKKENNDG